MRFELIFSILIIIMGIILGIFISKYLYSFCGAGVLLLIREITKFNKIKKRNNKRYEQISNTKVEMTEEKITESKEELLKQNGLIDRNISNLINQKSYDENEMNRLINTEESAEEIENEIENLEQELEEMNHKYDILDKTQKYLLQAKQQFSSHYLQGMTQGFKKYLNLISKN